VAQAHIRDAETYAAKAMHSGMIVDKFDNPANQLINLIPANERITELADWHSL
jgi:hypothetical protein